MKYIIQRNNGKVVFKDLPTKDEVINFDSPKEKLSLLDDVYAILDKHPRVQEIILNDKLSETL